MQFDVKNKWYTQLIPDPRVQSYLLGRAGDRDRLLAEPALRNKPIVRMEQVHGDAIALIRDLPTLEATALRGVDAAITTLPNVFLEVRVADCLPIVLWHPSGTIGVVHAGRKGTQQGILQKTLTTLRTEFDIANDLIVWFGPAICGEHYQVDRSTNEHYDLVAENKKQLLEACRNDNHQFVEFNSCTVESSEQFYSYRREGTSERNRVLIGVVSDEGK